MCSSHQPANGADSAPPVVPWPTFLTNVSEARENGFDRLCATCGVGVYDASDMHESACPEYEPMPGIRPAVLVGSPEQVAEARRLIEEADR